MRVQAWILAAGVCAASLSPVAIAQTSGSYPMSGSYSAPAPMPGQYPHSMSMSPPMSSYDAAYASAPSYGEGQRKRAAFLGPLLMQLMPMIVNPMVQSFVDSRRAQGSGRVEAPSLTEAFSQAPAAGLATNSSAPVSLPSMSAQQPSTPQTPMATAPVGIAKAAPAPSHSASMASMASSPAGFEAGIAYEVFHVQPDGAAKRISPAERVNQRGDRFYVHFMTNLAGQVLAYNVDPTGRRTALGEWSVDGGFPQRLPARGYFRFEGDEAGRELLEFQFTPCRNNTAGRNRAIRVVEEAENSLKACSEALAAQPGGRRMRAIVAVEDDKTAFATAPAAALGQEMSGLSVTLEFRKE